ncbi:hypothetical protein HCBAA847_1442 [Helicobacter cinaedi CCUG 18818 = ATCC BAA-847]|uniref:Uncharacterized protein n=4 Tax=Helicobacter cinaedi CCUG 18818 = ATCC BAA-847 TaxID=537971 RepID=A0AAI8MJK1_9HELI|nr:hypothetical protein [Helicobacter cinaedi]BAM32672.1 hypothetical protein HCBAA847_1442 [Helicobacter cinaedi CCUG 18818 = ATCC BAA-847]
MPIKATNLSYEEFNDRLLSLLKLVEGIQTKIYADSADIPKITIGIGFNIEVDIWREVVLMYKVGILQYADLENGVYTLANILGKQSQSTQTLINTTSKEIKDKINEYRINNKIQKNTYQTGKSPNQNMIDLQKDINTILQNNIKNYNEYPENINQKLNANMVFELTDNEAIEVKNIISFNEIKALRNKLNTWNANYLTSFSKTESINPQEFIPLLSIYYQRPARFNPESGLILLQKALKDKNRFLAWFSVRYYADIRQFKNPYYSRRIQEAAMFGLNNKDSNNQIEYFSTSLDIFSCLNFNFKEANTKQGLGLPDTYTYLSFMQTYKECKEIDETAKNLLKEYNIYHTKDKHYYSYVGKDEFQDITNILSPYLDYLNTLTQKTFSLENIYCIQSFYGNLGAKKLTNVASINKILSQRFPNSPKQPQPTQDSHTNPQTNNAQINPNERILATTQDSTTQTNLAQSTPLQDNTQSRLSQTNHTDNPTAQERVANPAQSTNENPTQILILYPKATPLPIQIIQPENTFLTLVVGKNAKLDCSKLLLDKCEIHYLQYDENQEESTENPKITALKTDSELTLTTKDSNLYEVIHNGIIYYISKNEGVLRVALGQDREEVIELYNFAKENEYRILKDCASQILDIQLKLQDNKELPTSHNGNFALTINNLTLLDKNGKNLDIAEDYTLYLHNCENRIIYENTSIQKNTDDTYRVNFSFDLIQDEDSNFFKRTTKLIIATQNLSNDFSTSEIHTKGNVAVVSLSSADKKGGNYTFTKKVSAQEFGEEIKTIYIDNDNPKAYQEQIDDSKKKLNIINIKAYSDKEQTNEIDTCDSETTIFVRAILNEEDRVFYDETIHWAYYIKGASEDLNKIDRDKIKQMENIEGNDIIFSLDMLAEDDKEILLKSLQNNSQKYELILFAYFKKPAIKVGNNITSIVLSMKTSQSMSSPTSPFTLNIKDYLCLTSP